MITKLGRGRRTLHFLVRFRCASIVLAMLLIRASSNEQSLYGFIDRSLQALFAYALLCVEESMRKSNGKDECSDGDRKSVV